MLSMSVAEVLHAPVGKGASNIATAVMMDFTYEIFAFGLHPVHAYPADALFGLPVEHSDNFLYLLFCRHISISMILCAEAAL